MGLEVVLLGPPGAGKGTQAQMLSKRYRIPHISTGDMLRDAAQSRDRQGQRVRAFMKRGELVPDELVLELVKSRLRKSDAKKGFLLDGFPRTEEQARSLDEALEEIQRTLDLVLYFKTQPRVILKRLTGRRICGQCGQIYNTAQQRQRRLLVCLRCGQRLIQREDDKKDTVLRRLEVYQSQTASLIDYYRKKGILLEVSGDQSIERLQSEIAGIFDGILAGPLRPRIEAGRR